MCCEKTSLVARYIRLGFFIGFSIGFIGRDRVTTSQLRKITPLHSLASEIMADLLPARGDSLYPAGLASIVAWARILF